MLCVCNAGVPPPARQARRHPQAGQRWQVRLGRLIASLPALTRHAIRVAVVCIRSSMPLTKGDKDW